MTSALFQTNAFTLRLLPSGAAHWAEGSCVFVADLHLGKDASFQRAGLSLPQKCTAATLTRLQSVISQTHCKHIWVLGDLVHDKHSLNSSTLKNIQSFQRKNRNTQLHLVLGNHDRSLAKEVLQRKRPQWLSSCVAEGHQLGPFRLWHHPPELPPREGCRARALPPSPEPSSSYNLSGHVHPGFAVHPLQSWGSHTLQLRSQRFPCFAFGPSTGLLPSFGEFTGSHLVASSRSVQENPDWSYHLLCEGEVIPVAPQLKDYGNTKHQ